MKLWVVQYRVEGATDDTIEWMPGKSAATNRAIELAVPVRVREFALPGTREEVADWLNVNDVKLPA